MAFKYVAIFALLAAASAAPQHYYEQPSGLKTYQPAVVKQVVQPAYVKKVVEHEEPANYDFEYAVKDEHTGDVKEQHESAKDGAVSGFYTLIDADGYKRTVHYTADDHHGFNAEVQREPIQGFKVAEPVVAVKKIVAAPVVQKYIAAPAPQYYSAPAPQYYSAPAPVKYSAPAPVHYSAPAPQYYSVPAPVKVAKYVAPVVAKVEAPAPYTHVSFKGPSSNYHY
jgi:Insect cuticle protein